MFTRVCVLYYLILQRRHNVEQLECVTYFIHCYGETGGFAGVVRYIAGTGAALR